jgi:hypothetical protein
MRKLITAAFVGAALCVPTVATASDWEDGQRYDNRGQCQSALMQKRNEHRRDPSLRPGNPDATPSEFNRAVRENIVCTQDSDGRWFVDNLATPGQF